MSKNICNSHPRSTLCVITTPPAPGQHHGGAARHDTARPLLLLRQAGHQHQLLPHCRNGSGLSGDATHNTQPSPRSGEQSGKHQPGPQRRLQGTWVRGRFLDGLKLDWCSSDVDISIDTIRYAVVLPWS